MTGVFVSAVEAETGESCVFDGPGEWNPKAGDMFALGNWVEVRPPWWRFWQKPERARVNQTWRVTQTWHVATGVSSNGQEEAE